MLRICPKCGAYYADDSLAFCLSDGTPLVDVDPGSERWNEGSRVIEEKEQGLRKQKRKLKWRWIAASAMTALILALVIAGSFTVETTVLVHNATPTPTPTPECSEADQISALKSLEPSWRGQLQGEQAKIIKENAPNIEKAEAGLERIEFQYSFPKPCATAMVTVTYTWRVSWPATPVSPDKSKNVTKETRFMCRKLPGGWSCPRPVW